MTVDELLAVTIADLEWSAEVDRVLIGPAAWVLRVRYRRSSSRSNSQRWVRFTLVPAEGVSFDEFAGHVEVAIVEHFRRTAQVSP